MGATNCLPLHNYFLSHPKPYKTLQSPRPCMQVLLGRGYGRFPPKRMASSSDDMSYIYLTGQAGSAGIGFIRNVVFRQCDAFTHFLEVHRKG
jgi:hypothetical protein